MWEPKRSHNGSEAQYFLISIFAEYNDFELFMVSGALLPLHNNKPFSYNLYCKYLDLQYIIIIVKQIAWAWDLIANMPIYLK